jgi:type I restriction enzyme S subunit
MKWKTVQIGTVTKIVSGSTPKSGNPAFWGGSIQWATPTDLSGLETKELSATGRQITKEGYESCSANMLPARSVLFSSRAPIGLVAINKEPVCTNQGFKSFVPDNARLSSDFLYWWLKCNRASLEHLGRGATFKEVSKSIIETVEIPLPPLDEQKRIAAILDAAEALRAKRRQSIAQLDALIQSTFLDLFGDPVTNPIHPTRCIAEIVSRIIDYRGKSPEKTSEGIPLITAKIVKKKGIDKPNEFIAETAYDSWMRRGIPSPQDVIITTEAPMGEVALVPDYKAAFAQRLLVLQPKREILEPIYLMWALTMPFVTRQMDQRATGSTVTGIRSKEFRKVEVPLPPLSLQQKFAAIVESIESQKTTQRTHLAELDDLFAALQHRAFRGEL